MSLKPTKKSDRDKKWLMPRKDNSRSIQPEYHLIISEGEKTEPNYFNALQNHINKKFRNRIHLDIIGKGKNTTQLVEYARKHVSKNPNGYSHVWIVFDIDDFPAEHIDLTVSRCIQLSTPQVKYHALWSNQCIELWFLLHFCYFQSDIDRKAYSSKLDKHLANIKAGKYEKNRPDMFDVLLPHLDTAIKNAKQLEASNEGKPASKSAPGTKVYELLESLQYYL